MLTLGSTERLLSDTAGQCFLLRRVRVYISLKRGLGREWFYFLLSAETPAACGCLLQLRSEKNTPHGGRQSRVAACPSPSGLVGWLGEVSQFPDAKAPGWKDLGCSQGMITDVPSWVRFHNLGEKASILIRVREGGHLRVLLIDNSRGVGSGQ